MALINLDPKRQTRSLMRLFVARAKVAQAEARFRDAATLYAEAVLLVPSRGDLHVQAGHMFKEAGDFAQAETHYDEATRLMPDNADLAHQLGHFYKISGRLKESAAAYARAAELSPEWAEPQKEMANLRKSGWRNSAGLAQDVAALTDVDPAESDLAGELRALKIASLYGTIAPENLPKPFREMVHRSEDSINLRQFGVVQNSFWGQKPVLRGIEAIRGFAISATPLTFVELRINGLPFHRGGLKGPYQLEYEPEKSSTRKYVFNIWCDLSQFAPGLYELELSLSDGTPQKRVLREEFVVEPPLLEADHPESDGIINLASDGRGTIDDQINALPSIVHLAERANMLGSVRNILIMRADQLGDLIASIPGIIRLRAIFPDARIVGIFSPANVELARTLNVLDEIIVLNFRESLYQRTRTLSLPEQEALREQLRPYSFDLAIDLSLSLMSRPLLSLSGARFTYGFKSADWPRLTASVDDAYHDAKNRREIAPHSTRIVTMIERLRALFSSSAQVIRREDLTREALRGYGIQDEDRYVVLHMGARIVFSRWPHYLALASRLIHETDLKIVLFTGDPKLRDLLPADLTGSDRVVILDKLLPFDEFDAFLSFCSVYVGNDSGPKHLASLRGVPVVSIHSARINWSEWGQEHTGVIIARKVPCSGCALYHDVDECGKDYICVNGITLQEVYDAVRRYVRGK